VRSCTPAAAGCHRLARYRCHPLTHLERGSGRPVRHYERAGPGKVVHAEIAQGRQNKWALISLHNGDRRRSLPDPDLHALTIAGKCSRPCWPQNNVKVEQVSRSLRATIVH
jgi:hypothetical protein